MNPSDLILDHYHHPKNFGNLDAPTHSAHTENLSCGDSLTVDIVVKDDIIERVGWAGNGCALSQASASMFSEFIKKKSVGDVENFSKETLLSLLGIETLSPARLRCALLAFESVKRALEKIINKKNVMSNVKDLGKPHGPITLANGWVVEVDTNVCIGAGPCVGVAPKTFELDSDAKAAILATCDEDDIETILNAARSCPVSAITVKNEKGETVFPN